MPLRAPKVHGNLERRKAAKEALVPLAWAIKHHLTALSETENDPTYLDKAAQIQNILFPENDI